jgi:tetratricopeptide (TPR) repeat protein
MDLLEREALDERWAASMYDFALWLCAQAKRDSVMCAAVTRRQLPNLMALLDRVERSGDAAATVTLASRLWELLRDKHLPRLLARVARVRDAATYGLADCWNDSRFQSERTRIEKLIEAGELNGAAAAARHLRDQMLEAGDSGYREADYGAATARWLLGRALRKAGQYQDAVIALDEARQCFEVVETLLPDRGAAQMAVVCFDDLGQCYESMGQLDKAAGLLEENARRAAQLGAQTDLAMTKVRLGQIRLRDRNYVDALAHLIEARDLFSQLNEPRLVATACFDIGSAYAGIDQHDAAEDAYQQSLSICVQIGDLRGQCGVLSSLGTLYGGPLGRPELGATYLRQAADRLGQLGDAIGEAGARNNLALAMRRLGRLDDARHEILRAIKCNEDAGPSSTPWIMLANLSEIEADAGDPAAAARALQKARESYLTYRQGGGETSDGDFRLAREVARGLMSGNAESPIRLLKEVSAHADLPASLRPFVAVLHSIVAGGRDPALSMLPDLFYTSSVEIQLLLEVLQKAPEAR